MWSSSARPSRPLRQPATLQVPASKVLCLDKLAPGGALINPGILHDYDEGSDGRRSPLQLTDEATVAGVEIGFGEVVALRIRP